MNLNDHRKLFSPVQIGPITLGHRVVMAPLTRSRSQQPGDIPNVAILKEGEAGVALSELTRKHGISRATYFNWQAKYGGVRVSELKRMKGLEAENAKNSGAKA